MSIGIIAPPLHDDQNDGIWNESAASIYYRVVHRDEQNRLTYCDDEHTIPDGVTQDNGVAQGDKAAVVTEKGEFTYFTAGAMIPSTGSSFPYVQATTNGKVIAFVPGVNHYACGKLHEPATADGHIVRGTWLGENAPNIT